MANQQPVAHATMPGFVVWIQDNLLLTLLIISSGFVNMVMLVDGIVPNIEDPATWGAFRTGEIIALAAAGLGLGGLALRISYKIAVCYSARQWGRVVFLAFGMSTFAFIEFWASFSQRAQHIATTPADAAVLSLFNIQNPSVSLTAVLISIVIPFASIFWGFAADDPAPKAVEDPATLKQRLENQLLEQQYRTQMTAARVGGLAGAVRAGVKAAQGIPPATETSEVSVSDAGEGTPEEPTPQDANVSATPPRAAGIPRGFWKPRELQAWVLAEYGVQLSEKQSTNALRFAGKNRQASSNGTPFIAKIAAAKRVAQEMYNLSKTVAFPTEMERDSA